MGKASALWKLGDETIVEMVVFQPEEDKWRIPDQSAAVFHHVSEIIDTCTYYKKSPALVRVMKPVRAQLEELLG